jgi:hypothetical protein
MDDAIGGKETGRRKADVLADAVNRFLAELSIKCSKDEGVRDYFDIGVLGYGASVGPAFGGSLAAKDITSISDVASNPLRVDERSKKVDDGAGGLAEQTVKFPIWLDPVTNNGTPMVQALGHAKALVENWMAQHPDSFPPIVIHFTDGESTDGDPTAAASAITSLSPRDGSVLLFNCHISSDSAPSTLFPDSDSALPNDFAKLLFRMSSPLPEKMRAAAEEEGLAAAEGSRGFAFNADAVALIQFLEVGTRTPQLR